MTPYRTSGRPPREDPPRDPVPDDDRIILWVALVISLLGLVPRVLEPAAPWGAEPTVALLIAMASAFLLIRRPRS